MNKFAAIVLMAFIAVASADPLELGGELDTESQMSLNPTDDQETGALDGKMVIFADFCIASRDNIIGDIKRTSNGFAANVFGLFFGSATAIGMDAFNVQKDAAEKIGEQIRNPDTPIGDYDHDDQVASIIAEGQQSIQENSSQPKSLFQGIVSTLSATKNIVTTKVVGQLNNLREKVSLGAVEGALKSLCERAERYDQAVHQEFAEFLSKVTDPELANTKLEQVPCLTARRAIRIDGICKTVMAIQSPLIKAVAYKQIPQ